MYEYIVSIYAYDLILRLELSNTSDDFSVDKRTRDRNKFGDATRRYMCILCLENESPYICEFSTSLIMDNLMIRYIKNSLLNLHSDLHTNINSILTNPRLNRLSPVKIKQLNTYSPEYVRALLYDIYTQSRSSNNWRPTDFISKCQMNFNIAFEDLNYSDNNNESGDDSNE